MTYETIILSNNLTPTNTHLANNIENRRNHIIQQTPRLHALLRRPRHRILLHHLVIQKPQALRHVPNIARLAPDAEEQHQVDDAGCDGGGCGHACGGGGHFGEVGTDSLVAAPFHVIAEHLGVECVYGRGRLQCRWENLTVHVASIVTQKNQQMLRLVSDARILKSEKVAEVFARRVDHVC